MRPIFIAYSGLASLFLTFACGDKVPTYPPLPDSAKTDTVGGSDSQGATTTGGSGNHSTAGKSGATGGKSNASGGSGGAKPNAGGSAGTPPTTDDYCETFANGDEPPEPSVACDLDNLTDGGELSGDLMDKTLESGKVYTLKGVTRVMPGKTLTIPPCVVIKGQDRNAVLVVLAGGVGDPSTLCTFTSGTKPGPGGKLVAVGEPMAPIIFTSSKPAGSRAPGDWGGVLLLGNAHYNKATSTALGQIEGLERTECYGWATDEFDDSNDTGSLAYVRIEYASRQTGEGNETNGLTLAALGNKTKIHHVMVSNSGDDCFEFFGGTVDVDHLIALNCDDDGFDADNGFQGHAQFLFGRQGATSTETDSRGFEIDSANPPADSFFTTAAWSNFTMCGGGPEDVNAVEKLRAGLVMRSNAKGSLSNGIITGFSGGGISLQTSAATTLDHSTVFDNHDRPYGSNHVGGADWLTKQEGNSAEAPLGFCDCWANPPSAVAAEPLSGSAPAGFADDGADYQGAFADASAGSNWMKGLWVDWSSE